MDTRMSDDADRAYGVWLTVGERSPTRTAQLTGHPVNTVRGWSNRYRWLDRAKDEDASSRDSLIAAAVGRMALLLPDAVGVLADAVAGADVSRQRLAAAFGVLDRFGLSPVTRSLVDVSSRPAPYLPVSDADLDQLVAAGDVASLLALASGRPMPGASDADTLALPPGDASLD